METHAHHIPHVDVTDTQTEKYVAADFTLMKNDTPVAAESRLISAVDRKNDNVGFGNPYNFPYFTDDSTKYSSGAEIHARLIRKAERIDRDCELGCTKDQRENRSRQYARTANDDAGNEVTSVCALNADHVYKEVQVTEELRNSYDVQNYYEEHNPATAKALIDTLFLPRYEICKECAEMHHHSPVYTDRLIYAKKSLLAVEVVLCHREDVSCFKYCDRREPLGLILCSQHNADRDQDCMLIYSYVKTNAAGIFYSHCWPRDVFDLESILKPSIYVINRACNVVVNTQLYHRYVNNYHVRISRAGYAPMTFRHDRAIMIDCTKRISCNDDLLDSLNYRRRRLRDDDNDEYRQDRSSLLLLEPLLLMPELASPRHDKKSKKHVLQSERTKVIRILVAYALSFFVLASITFYVVYFT